jgi:hypothetical protein
MYNPLGAPALGGNRGGVALGARHIARQVQIIDAAGAGRSQHGLGVRSAGGLLRVTGLPHGAAGPHAEEAEEVRATPAGNSFQFKEPAEIT